MAQALQHNTTALIPELSATSTADINPRNPSGSERSNAIVSIPLVQNIRQVSPVNAVGTILAIFRFPHLTGYLVNGRSALRRKFAEKRSMIPEISITNEVSIVNPR